MTSIDLRTRRRHEVQDLAAGFVRRELLQTLAAANAGIAARGIGATEAGTLSISAGTEKFSISASLGNLTIRDGIAGSGVVVSMDDAALSDLFQDVVSLGWLQMMGRLELQSGSLERLVRWDPVIVALRDGVPVYDGRPGDPGSKLSGRDLDRTFTLDDDPGETGAFLAETGFLHIRGVFSPEEMQAVSHELDAAMHCAERDDGQSWWARTEEGWYPSRILGFNRKSPTLRELLHSRRFQSLASFVDDPFVHGDIEASDMAEGLLKKIGVSEGISDVTWHKDCGPGGHSYGCAGLVVGIQLTGADQQSGELCVMAGSNRANIPGLHSVGNFGLDEVALTTAAGDCTIHCSCTMHMSRPPIDKERRVVYTGFHLQPFEEEVSALPSESTRREQRAGLQDRVGAAVRAGQSDEPEN